MSVMAYIGHKSAMHIFMSPLSVCPVPLTQQRKSPHVLIRSINYAIGRG